MLKNNRLLNSVHKMQVFLFSFLALMATFVSLNTRGLRSPDRWQTAFSIFRRARFDLICLQETHWTAELKMEIKRDWDGEVFQIVLFIDLNIGDGEVFQIVLFQIVLAMELI